ncbi:MAG: Type 1 glutamine amidotransferase-like domain-containing protein [Patescibacteria group bacterium]
MKLILFGGAESGQAEREVRMIVQIINEIKPRQVLHIPFARITTNEAEWTGDWFGRYARLAGGIEYLNAARRGDIAKVKRPLVFISGGSQNFNLLKKLKASPRLRRLISEASVVIGESAGAMVLGAYLRSKGGPGGSALVKGLGIIKDTIIEPHYTQRARQALLVQEMAETGARYGLGIDAMVAAEFMSGGFPRRIKKIGRGRVELKINRGRL